MHRLLRQARAQAAAQHVAGLFTTVIAARDAAPYFKLEKVRITEGVEEPVPYDQPVVWMMLEGEAQVRVRRRDGADRHHPRRDGPAARADEEPGRSRR